MWSRLSCGSSHRRRALRRGDRRTGRRLHLGACDRQLVADPMEALAGDRERREAGLRRLRSRAPISRSGAEMRSTGRLRIDASPSSVERAGRPAPASQPGSSRISVPALPTSMVRVRLARLPADPAPRRRTSSGRRSTSAPSACTAAQRRAACPRPRGSCEIRTGVSAIAPSSAIRWEIDLSGGGTSVPFSGPLASTRTVSRDIQSERRQDRDRLDGTVLGHPQVDPPTCVIR